jgi:hypothetical protein
MGGYYTKEFAGIEFLIDEDGKTLDRWCTGVSSLGHHIGEYPHDATEILSKACGELFKNQTQIIKKLDEQVCQSFPKKHMKEIFHILEGKETTVRQSFIKSIDKLDPVDIYEIAKGMNADDY